MGWVLVDCVVSDLVDLVVELLFYNVGKFDFDVWLSVWLVVNKFDYRF